MMPDDETIERDLFARRARALDDAALAKVPSLDDVLRAAGAPAPVRRLPRAAVVSAFAVAAAVLLGVAFGQMNSKAGTTAGNGANGANADDARDANAIGPDPAAAIAPAAPAASPALPASSRGDTCSSPSSADESSCQSSCGEEPSATP